MSLEDAAKFIAALQSNEDLLQKVNAASAEIVKIAQANGFDVSSEEISAALKTHFLANPLAKFFPLSEAPRF